MKVVVVGDTLVKSDDLAQAAQQMNLGADLDIKKFEWFNNLTKDQFQEKILQIEKGGSEAVPIPDGILEELKDAEYLFVHIAPVSKKMIEAAPKLKMIGACRGGMENVNVEEATKHNIQVIHVIRNAEPVADFTLALMYVETRNIARAFYSIKEGKWEKSFANDPYKTTLKNLKVGLVGLGHVGKLVAKRLNALEIETCGYDPFVTASDIAREGLKITLLDIKELFKTCDIISLHMRVTEDTKNMINKDLISLMKPSAYLINTARAGVLKKDDLVEVLDKHLIAGAALDVFWEEPIPQGDKLLELDNVTLTTHIAGDTIDAIPRSPYLLKDVINDYLAKGFSAMQVNLRK